MFSSYTNSTSWPTKASSLFITITCVSITKPNNKQLLKFKLKVSVLTQFLITSAKESMRGGWVLQLKHKLETFGVLWLQCFRISHGVVYDLVSASVFAQVFHCNGTISTNVLIRNFLPCSSGSWNNYQTSKLIHDANTESYKLKCNDS